METEKRLMSVINAVKVLNSTRDLPEVLHQLIKEVLNVIGGANAAVLFLYESRSNTLYAQSAIGFDMEQLRHVRLAPGEGMSGKTFVSQKGNIFSSLDHTVEGMKNLTGNSEHYYARSLGEMAYPVSAICVPIMSRGGQMSRVLTVDIFEKDRQFDQSDLQLLETFAGQASIAVENARLFSQNKRTKLVHEELSKVSLAKGGLSDITKALAGLIQEKVVVFNERTDVLAVSDKDAAEKGEALKIEAGPLLKYAISRKSSSTSEALLNGNPYLTYFLPIQADGLVLGLLAIIVEKETVFDPLDQFAIEQAITIFAMEMNRRDRFLAEDFHYSGAVLEQLIHAPYNELSSDALTRLNFPEHDRHHYAVVHLYVRDPLLPFQEVGEKKKQLMRVIYREMESFPFKTLVYERNMEVTFMFTVSASSSEQSVFDTLEPLFTSIIHYGGQECELKSLAGFGQVVDKLQNVHLSYQDAKRCVQYLQTGEGSRALMTYRQLGPYRLFLKMERGELQDYADEVLGQVAEHDRKHETELLKTLKVYVESNQNMAASAKKLYVHVNTIKYRLQSIYQLLQTDKLDGRELFELQLGLHILEYLNTK
ncbi:helix-turn-helix domain-containing protein [Sinobaca sp. H24]|uniref:helix-turn-helix domain-containing protein n=1 Tax=Sinobaca sp. H24 TaxID=2923376 RepID=UPI00207945C5|nr:helix-turn-helix domain-containing protein [Sinobaca sp. H24]